MSLFKPKEALTGMVVGNRLHVEQLTSKTGRLYSNTTIKSMRNRLLLICWKPQLSSLWMAHWRHMGVNAAAVAQRGYKSVKQAAAMPSDTFRQMLGPVPLTVYTKKRARPAEVEI